MKAAVAFLTAWYLRKFGAVLKEDFRIKCSSLPNSVFLKVYQNKYQHLHIQRYIKIYIYIYMDG